MLKNRASAWIIIAVLGLFVFSGLPTRLTDMLFYPWALADPPLLDRWVGRLTTGDGAVLDIGLELQRDLDRRDLNCWKCNQIEGVAVTCDARGRARRYQLSGSPEDRSGSRIHLGAKPDPDPAPDGLELDQVRGRWNGGNQIEAEAGFFWRKGGVASSSTGDPATLPVPVRLERGGKEAFDAMCAALR